MRALLVISVCGVLGGCSAPRGQPEQSGLVRTAELDRDGDGRIRLSRPEPPSSPGEDEVLVDEQRISRDALDSALAGFAASSPAPSATVIAWTASDPQRAGLDERDRQLAQQVRSHGVWVVVLEQRRVASGR